jgi:hypothetical protein
MLAAKNTTFQHHIINQCLTNKGKKHWTTDEFFRKLVEKGIHINARNLLATSV